MSQIKNKIITFEEASAIAEPGVLPWIIHSEKVVERRERLGFNPIEALEGMGVDPQNMTGIQISAEHPVVNDLLVQRIPLFPTLFSGSIMMHEYDHLMLAGAASDMLLNKIKTIC